MTAATCPSNRRDSRRTCGTPSRASHALSIPPSRVARPPARMPRVTSGDRSGLFTWWWPIRNRILSGAGWCLAQAFATERADALPAALDVADQAPLLRDLLVRQHVFLVLVRILAFLEHETHGRTDELEPLAEEVLEVTTVRIRQRAQAGAVDDEGRWIFAARMRESQLGHVPAHHRWRIRLVSDLERLGRFCGRKLVSRRCMRAMDRLEQLAQPRAVQRGDVHRFGPVDEAEFPCNQRVGLLALVVALPVPFVDCHDQRAACIQH